MKKIVSVLALILAVCLLATCLIACGEEKDGNGGSGSSDGFKTDEEIKAELGENYYIEFYLQGTKNVVARKGTSAYYKSESVEFFSKKTGEKYSRYGTQSDGETFGFLMDEEENGLIDTIDVLIASLTPAEISGESTKKEIKFIGRSATEYTYNERGAGIEVKSEEVVDNKTGISLKRVTIISGADEDAESRVEVSKLYIGNDNEIKKFFDGMEARIADAE